MRRSSLPTHCLLIWELVSSLPGQHSLKISVVYNSLELHDTFLSLLTSFSLKQARLSMALGAFLASLLLEKIKFSLQVESDIAPYHGLLLGIFFMTVGTSFWDLTFHLIQGFGVLLLHLLLFFFFFWVGRGWGRRSLSY